MPTTHPSVSWAQRSSSSDEARNIIFLTIEVLDPINIKLDLHPTKLQFSADSQDSDTHYSLDVEFFDEIVPEKSVKNMESGNHIFLLLRKKTMKEEYWPRLTKEKLKCTYIKTDFDKWVDEDEQDEKHEEDDMSNMMGGGAGGAGGADLSQLMQGMGGAGGNPDFSQLASQLGEAGGKADTADDSGDDEDEEEVEEVNKKE